MEILAAIMFIAAAVKVADTIISTWVIDAGGKESNPVITYFWGKYPTSSDLSLYTFIYTCIVFGSYAFMDWYAVFPISAMTLVTGYVVYRNYNIYKDKYS